MNVEAKVKVWRDISIGIIVVIVLGLSLLFYIKWYHKQKIHFLTPMLGQRSELFLKYVKKYKNDWLEELARIRTESDFDRNCIGTKKEAGWYQILPSTHKGMVTLVKQIARNPNDKHEIILIMGNLYYAAMRRYTGDWMKATEAYNIGIGGMRAGRKNSKYLERYLQSYEFLLQEWNDFL